MVDESWVEPTGILAGNTDQRTAYDYLIYCVAEPSAFPDLETRVQEIHDEVGLFSVIMDPDSLQLNMADPDDALLFLQVVLTPIDPLEGTPLLVLLDAGGHTIFQNAAIADAVKELQEGLQVLLLWSDDPVNHFHGFRGKFDYVIGKTDVIPSMKAVLAGGPRAAYVCRET